MSPTPPNPPHSWRRIVVRTLFYYFILLALLLLWKSSGFIYENF